MFNGAAVLPAGRMNPRHPEQNEYHHESAVLYIMAKDGGKASRVLMSAGHLGDKWPVGSVHSLFHDQSGAQMGWYHVVGYVSAQGHMLGEVPDKSLAMAVFK